MKKSQSEFDNFDRTMRDLMKVPHSEIKAKLDAEKAEKMARPKKRGRPLSRPLGRVSSGRD
jgi:hypothetical protein